MKYLVRKLEIIEEGKSRFLSLHYVELHSPEGDLKNKPHIYPYEKEEAGASFITDATLEIGNSHWVFNIN